MNTIGMKRKQESKCQNYRTNERCNQSINIILIYKWVRIVRIVYYFGTKSSVLTELLAAYH